MAIKDNQSKKRYYPLRDASNPYKVTLVEITETQYRALYPEIWATQKREQHHHRCMCSKKHLWECDGDCIGCKYHAAGDTLSLDIPTEDGEVNMYDCIPDSSPSMENVIADRLLLDQLFNRLENLIRMLIPSFSAGLMITRSQIVQSLKSSVAHSVPSLIR